MTDEDDGTTTISIGLPLPMAVTGALMAAIDQMWPDAQLAGGVPGHMSIKIDARLRPVDFDLDALNDEAVHDEDLGDLEVMDPRGVKLRPCEKLALMLHDVFATAFDDHPGAMNYVEMPLINGTAVTIYRHRDALSPHQAREFAEARVAALEAQLAEHGITPVEADEHYEIRRAHLGWIETIARQVDELTAAGHDDAALELIEAAEHAAEEAIAPDLVERLRQRLGR